MYIYIHIKIIYTHNYHISNGFWQWFGIRASNFHQGTGVSMSLQPNHPDVLELHLPSRICCAQSLRVFFFGGPCGRIRLGEAMDIVFRARILILLDIRNWRDFVMESIKESLTSIWNRSCSSPVQPDPGSLGRRMTGAGFELAEDAECAICWERLKVHGFERLSCGHAFHSACQRAWLATHSTCPLCRARVAWWWVWICIVLYSDICVWLRNPVPSGTSLGSDKDC